MVFGFKGLEILVKALIFFLSSYALFVTLGSARNAVKIKLLNPRFSKATLLMHCRSITETFSAMPFLIRNQ